MSADAVDHILDVGDVPTSAAGGADAASVERAGKATQIHDAGVPKRGDDQQDVGGECVGCGRRPCLSRAG